MTEQIISIHEYQSLEDLPPWLTVDSLAHSLHEWLKPYEDTLEDIRRGIEDALPAERPSSAENGNDGRQTNGFVLVAETGRRVQGALVMLRTGMKGYVPENLLLFVAVAPSARGKKLGSRLVQKAIESSEGNVKLHVEYENPAKRLYERLGFTNKYAEMRFEK